MILKNVLDLRKKINEHRLDLYVLEKNNGISHLAIVEVRRNLEKEILQLQKIINEIRA